MFSLQGNEPFSSRIDHTVKLPFLGLATALGAQETCQSRMNMGIG